MVDYFIGQYVRECNCGCGEEICYKLFYKYYGIPKYILGHHPVWNKGLTKEDNEAVMRISKAKVGNRYGEGLKIRVNLNKFCLLCNKKLSRKQILQGKKYCSKRCYWITLIGKEPWNKGLVGFQAMENHPNWRGGVSFEKYGRDFNKLLKLRIRERDCFTCQECYISEEELGFILDVHHIDYDKRNNNPNNLIGLCRYCHMETNFNRDSWKRWFQILKNEEVILQ